MDEEQIKIKDEWIEQEENKCQTIDKSITETIIKSEPEMSTNSISDDPLDIAVHEEISQNLTYNCSHCPSVFNEISALEEHFSRVHERKKLDIQEKSLAKSQAYRSKNLNFHCSICLCVFNNQNALELHCSRVHEGKINAIREHKVVFQCPLCQKVFHTKDDLKSHQMVHKEKTHENNKEKKVLEKVLEKPVVEAKTKICSYCLVEVQSRGHFKHENACSRKFEHGEKSEKEKYSQESSDSNFTLNSKTKYKIETVHEGKKPSLECPLCQKVFHTNEDVNTHSLMVHKAQIVVNEETVSSFKKRAKRQNFPCPICFEIFTKEYYLAGHVKSVHEGEISFFPLRGKPPKIKDDLSFMNVNKTMAEENIQIKSEPIDFGELDVPSDNLDDNTTIKKEFPEIFVKSELFIDANEHCQVQLENEDEGKVIETHETSKTIDESKKIFSCPTCFKVFQTNYDFERHVLVHGVVENGVVELKNSHETEFQCSACYKKFKSKYVAKRHFKQLHKNKTIRCNFCPKRFSCSSEYKIHISKFHEGSRPFRCIYCPERFGSKSEFNTHFVKFHEGRNLKVYHSHELNSQDTDGKSSDLINTLINIEQVHENNSIQDISEMIIPD